MGLTHQLLEQLPTTNVEVLKLRAVVLREFCASVLVAFIFYNQDFLLHFWFDWWSSSTTADKQSYRSLKFLYMFAAANSPAQLLL